MLRKTVVFVLYLACIFTLPGVVWAVPAAPTIHNLAQPDGLTFEARLRGDERAFHFETLEGFTVVQGEDGVWYFAEFQNGVLVPTTFKVGTVDPRTLGIPPHLHPTPTEDPDLGGAIEHESHTFGNKLVAVILLRFQDVAFGAGHTAAHYNALLTGAANSLYDYLDETSRGQFGITPTIVGPFTSTHNMRYYGADGNDTDGDGVINTDSGAAGTPVNVYEMAREAVQLANPTTNFAPFDSADADTNIDFLIVVHAGRGQEQTGTANDIWSHRWNISPREAVDGVNARAYLTVPEDGDLGVFAHEFGHLLGLPDLYDTDDSSNGVGNWCLMGTGSWNGDPEGSSPAHPSAWCKYHMGWVIPKVIACLEDQTIKPAENAGGDIHRFLENPDGADWVGTGEYFLVENRQLVGYDAGLPGRGLIIYHVDESVGDNDDEDFKMVDVEEADGRTDLDDLTNRGDAGDLFVNDNDGFTDTTAPNSNLYSGSDSTLRITDVSGIDISGNMTFDAEFLVPSTFTGRVRWRTQALDPGIDPYLYARLFPGIGIKRSRVSAIWDVFDWAIYHSLSQDNGEHWQSRRTLPTLDTEQPFHRTGPTIAVDGDVVHAAWAERLNGRWELFYLNGTFNRNTGKVDWPFSPTQLTQGWARAFDSENPDIAAVGGRVHLVWEDNRNGDQEIFYNRSLDGGTTWDFLDTDGKIISPDDGEPSINAAIALSSNRDHQMVHVVYQDSKDFSTEPGKVPEIYYVSSTDRGSNWDSGPVRITNADHFSGEPDIAVLSSKDLNNDRVYVVWTDQRLGWPEVYFKKMRWDGSTLNQQDDVRLADFPGTENPRDEGSFEPAIAVTGNPAPTGDIVDARIHVVWVDNGGSGNAPNPIISRAKHRLGKEHLVADKPTWGVWEEFSDLDARFGTPAVAACGNTLHCAWIGGGRLDLIYSSRLEEFVDPVASPGTPGHGTPAPKEETTSATPIFTMSATHPEGFSVQYRLELSTDDFGSIFKTFDQTVSDIGWSAGMYASGATATFTVPESDALPDGTYQWRVQAFDGVNFSPVSEATSFSKVPPFRSIEGVPFYAQQNSFWSVPACLEMVFDFYGPHIAQAEIKKVSATGDLPINFPFMGTRKSDARRAGHFSDESTLDSLTGYTGRGLGYAALEYTTLEDASAKKTLLKDWVKAGTPVILSTASDVPDGVNIAPPPPQGNFPEGIPHARVLVGFNDKERLFFFLDPWFGTIQMPVVAFDQDAFVNFVWDGWALLVQPWDLRVEAPGQVPFGGEAFEVKLTATYPVLASISEPSGLDVTSPEATLTVPAGFALAPGEMATKSLSDLAGPGSSGTASWMVVPPDSPVSGASLLVKADGTVSTFSFSYPNYSDRIGGEAEGKVSAVNVPPFADAGPDIAFLQTSPGTVAVPLDGSRSSDPNSTPGTNDDIVSFVWSEDGAFLAWGQWVTANLRVGVHTVRLTVTDQAGASSEDDLVVTITSLDSDGDGVPDSEDLCPDTPGFAIDAGVIGSDGCVSCDLLSEYVNEQVPQSGEYKNHGDYVSRAGKIVSLYLDAGLITEECASGIVNPIARSDVGKPVKDR